jgi:hypothetical protein
MGWEVIKRQSKPTPRLSVPNVTVAWRFVDGEKNQAVIIVTKALVDHLGWGSVRRVLIMTGTQQNLGKVYIVPSPPGATDCRAAAVKGGTMTINVHLDGVQSERRPAQSVHYEIARGGIEITLPDWAARERLVANTDKALTAVVEVAKRQPFVSIMSRVPDPNIGRRFG